MLPLLQPVKTLQQWHFKLVVEKTACLTILFSGAMKLKKAFCGPAGDSRHASQLSAVLEKEIQKMYKSSLEFQ